MNRRRFLQTTVTASAALSFGSARGFAAADPSADEAPLGQGKFRYRVNRQWGQLDPAFAPVDDCHAITEDRAGRILLLTTNTRNNVIVYTRAGEFVSKQINRFPSAHALELGRAQNGDEVLWITDNQLATVSLCAADGRELRSLSREALETAYAPGEKYHPTNVAAMPDGDFFVSDGYGSSRILHFDPKWKLVREFGGTGQEPHHLNQPHAVWLDQRRGAPELLVCDRGNEALKWFSPVGELLRVVPLPGARPCNITALADGHLIIPCLNAMILVLDRSDRVVSVIGGEPARYAGDTLQPLAASPSAFTHPHDAYIDAEGDIYVAQWNSQRSYPMKLQRLAGA